MVKSEEVVAGGEELQRSFLQMHVSPFDEASRRFIPKAPPIASPAACSDWSTACPACSNSFCTLSFISIGSKHPSLFSMGRQPLTTCFPIIWIRWNGIIILQEKMIYFTNEVTTKRSICRTWFIGNDRFMACFVTILAYRFFTLSTRFCTFFSVITNVTFQCRCWMKCNENK